MSVPLNLEQVRKWLWYPSDAEPKIRLLDSRGLGESEAPTEEFEEDTPLDELIKAVTEEQPDVFLFLIKAKKRIHVLKKIYKN